MVSSKSQKVLKKIFRSPSPSDLRWSDIETLIVALGGTIEEAAGSRVRIRLNDRRAVFHRPHPKPETDKGAVVAMRRFLISAGAEP